MYCGRWSEECQVTIEYRETTRYGSRAEGWGRYPSVRLGKLEIGKTYHYRVTAVDLIGNLGVCPDATFTVGDTIPPCKILISLERLSDSQIRLTFKAPGEDSNFGTAAEYDLRWSDSQLRVDTWNQATRVKDVVKPSRAHTVETITLDGFPRGRSYHFAVRAIDDHGNVGLCRTLSRTPRARK